MTPNVLLAAIISVILITIMIPLTITSFPSVRRKMGPNKWKKLQKTAYLFYGLIYAHVMLLMAPLAIKGNITYAVMRIRKASVKKEISKSKAA